MSLLFPLVVSSLLFSIGTYVVMARRHAVLVLMGVELVLQRGQPQSRRVRCLVA
ncbi:MAG: NADH-quinone oxidoreductase subunit K [Nocardioidaceae bacterium]